MAPKKAAKKVPGKAAKKAAKKAPGHKRGQDMRRAYEHFGRVSALLPLLSDAEAVTRMVGLAQGLLRDGHLREAADVLRAAEHLCFGRLAMEAEAETVSAQLEEVLAEEYRHLVERADAHAGELTGAVARMYTLLRKEAARAFKAERWRAASELARGAEALAHVTVEVAGRLRGGELRQLETS